MYSFESYFVEFFENNSQYQAFDIREADFVLLPHCAAYLYHQLRYLEDDSGYRRFDTTEQVRGGWGVVVWVVLVVIGGDPTFYDLCEYV